MSASEGQRRSPGADPASFEAQLTQSREAICELLALLDVERSSRDKLVESLSAYACSCGDLAPPPSGYVCPNCEAAR